MSIHTFAAIYIGSYEVSIKIFELSTKKKIRSIDYVRRRIELGKDAYTKGRIGSELVKALCDTLEEFVGIIGEYKVDHYEAYVSEVLRDAENELFILDQIKIRTGLSVRVLSNSEHRFINYKSIAMKEEFEELIQKSAAVVDVGGNGLQITIFSKGRAVTTQHLELGTLRLREKLAKKSSTLAQYEFQMEELVEKELKTFRALYFQGTKVEYLIIIGDYIRETVHMVEKGHSGNTVEVSKFVRYVEQLGKKNVEEISEELGLANEEDALIVPYLVVFKCMAKGLESNFLWAPGVIISDGIACDYAQKKHLYRLQHDFDADVIAAARNLAARYMSYTPHIEALMTMSTLIFDTMKKVHGMGKRERLLLQVAAILHDCGRYISLANGPHCSFDIIMASEIIGLSHLERLTVAYVTLCKTRPLAPYEELADILSQEDYVVVAKLSAILRVSNAMDRSNKQKFRNIKAAIRDKELVITIETGDDIALEKALFDAKTDYFEKIFSIKPVIKEKRVYT